MKFFVDLFPVLLFFITYTFYDDVVGAESAVCLAQWCIAGGKSGAIYAATLVAIIASFIQVSLFWLKYRRFENMQVITLALLVVLGSATLFLQNEAFIKWKPTAVNWLFAAVFLGSQLFGSKPLVQRMMEGTVKIDKPTIWLRLNLGWVAFFLAMGIVNLYVAFNFGTTVWVNFKLFGILGLTFLFVIGQAVYLTRHILPEEETLESKDAQNRL